MQQAREAARRSECRNKLKQIGLALHNYHDAHSVFPMGSQRGASYSSTGGQGLRGAAWLHFILPYIDQSPFYNSELSARMGMDTSAFGDNEIYRVPGRFAVMPVYQCPSDPSHNAFTNDGFQGSYLMCSGSNEFGNYPTWPGGAALGPNTSNGMFYHMSTTKIRDVVDGTSNTLMGGEAIIRGKGQITAWDVGDYWNGGWGGIYFSANEPPNTPVADRIYGCKSTTWPNSPCVSCAASCTNARVFARSYHAGGAVFLLADGSVRFISSNIDRGTYRALATMFGNETVGEF